MPARWSRVVLIAAHPDDETIGAGLHLAQWPELHIVHVTDGAPRDLHDSSRRGFASWQEYARVRRDELQCALGRAGARPELVELGVPDQQVSIQMGNVAREVRSILERLQPEMILTHPYEGGHPDHDACAAAVRHAVDTLPNGYGKLWEFAGYHSNGGALRDGVFLSGDPQIVWEFDSAARARKRSIAECFTTQRETLSLFRFERECFRPAPRYDFRQPPHAGQLYYEQYGWGGMTGEKFRARAAELFV